MSPDENTPHAEHDRNAEPPTPVETVREEVEDVHPAPPAPPSDDSRRLDTLEAAIGSLTETVASLAATLADDPSDIIDETPASVPWTHWSPGHKGV